MDPVGARSHSRKNTSFTAHAEKHLLIWIAERLPRAVHSDHLSALGLASMMVAGVAFAAFRLSPGWAAAAAVGALVANWFGDSLDGTVARVRHQQRPRYGFYVDHVIDLAGTTMLLGGLACSGLMHPIVALAVLIGYLLVSSESYLATCASGVFRMSFLGFGPTELRLLLIAGAVKAAHSPWVSPAGLEPIRLFDIGGGLAAAGLTCAFIAAAAQNTRALYVAEPLPSRTDEAKVA